MSCFKCHGSRSDPMEGRCLDCHKGVAYLRERGRGLHGRAGLGDCATCHPEHAGVGFDLIQWKEGRPETFDHARAGWPLTGHHAGLRCESCHQERFRVSPAAGLSPRSGKTHGWIGLETACGSCHEDIHKGSLGADCATCHDPSGWKPARSFDHARTDFPLQGRHAGLECAKCHLAPGLKLAHDAKGNPVPLYKPLPHAECSDCHRDVHEGRLGAACSTCHTVDGFRKVVASRFDHDRTRYPLRGAHRSVSCESCHGTGAARVERPKFSSCASCHADPHAGKATLRGKPADCGACHSVDGWKKPTFTVAQHARSAYPLEGKHATVACAACHVTEKDPARARALGKAGVLIRPSHDRCTDCHADAHAGQLASRPGGTACEGCHTPAGWKPSLFTAEAHRKLSMPLEGAHAKAPCSACHGPQRPGLRPLPGKAELGTARVALRLDEKRCTDCHADPHDGRFAGAAAAASGAPAGSSGCLDCHTMDAFVPSTVDADAHARFTFPLEGAHRAVPCLDCHEPLKAKHAASSLVLAGGAKRDLGFGRKRARCEDCHQGPHGTQFAGRKAGGCASCHTVDAWKPASRFDHDRDASFSIKGAHARVACARCHATREVEGRAQVVYRPVAGRCVDCHAGSAVEGGSPS